MFGTTVLIQVESCEALETGVPVNEEIEAETNKHVQHTHSKRKNWEQGIGVKDSHQVADDWDLCPAVYQAAYFLSIPSAHFP